MTSRPGRWALVAAPVLAGAVLLVGYACVPPGNSTGPG